MSDLTKRLCRPGYDLQKEQAIQEAIIEIRELRAKIAEMEKQEPVAWCATDETGTVVEALGMNQSRRFDTALGFLPRAKGEEK